ncbi:glutathione S-transferase family protein [Roseibium sediminis]|uniref:glutathione S-transferase family protein n=1 Tax=Roseibium sediminis TaxID=1775174 RepID=UPI001FCCB28A|nr:glutathione S-transferase family protein [Roseibium sediminis]
MIRILGRLNSVNVQKVMWCAAELGVEIQQEDVGGAFGGTDTDDYLSKNPNGRIPTLEDGDFVLWESNSIVRYLCDKYGKDDWLPDTPQLRALANQWMDWYIAQLHPPMTTLFWQLIRIAPDSRDLAALHGSINTSEVYWTLLDAHLKGRTYLLGDRISMADIPLGCSAYRWHSMTFERRDLPHLAAWYHRLTVRPAFRENVMLELT